MVLLKSVVCILYSVLPVLILKITWFSKTRRKMWIFFFTYKPSSMYIIEVFNRKVLITSIFPNPLKTYCNNFSMMNIQIGASQDFQRHPGQKRIKYC